MTVQVLRAADRFVTRADGTVTYHSFSFGGHYDPDNVAFGVLLAHNDEFVPPGVGYDWHRHRDVEIVTYVAEGMLLHEDRLGHRAVTPAGSLQLLSAGTGAEHAERSADGRPVRFVQAWLSAAEDGPPAYRALGAVEEFVPARQRAARLRVLHVRAGQTVRLPAAPLVHLFVVDGTVSAGGAEVLEPGDALGPGDMLGQGDMLGPGDALRATAGPALSVTAAAPADVLVWLLGTPSA